MVQSEGSQSTPNIEAENGAESWDAKMDLWKPLNDLVEIASRTKSFKSNTQRSDAKPEHVQVNESDSLVQKIKNKENKRKAKVEDEKSSPFPVCSDTAKPNKLRRVRRKKEPFGESGVSPQAVVDSTSNKHLKSGPIWFSLIASENQ
jgi:E3 ubiquitin-protein ligase DRIP